MDISKNCGQKKRLNHYYQRSVCQPRPFSCSLGAPSQVLQGLGWGDVGQRPCEKIPARAGGLGCLSLAWQVAPQCSLRVLDTSL